MDIYKQNVLQQFQNNSRQHSKTYLLIYLFHVIQDDNWEIWSTLYRIYYKAETAILIPSVWEDLLTGTAQSLVKEIQIPTQCLSQRSSWMRVERNHCIEDIIFMSTAEVRIVGEARCIWVGSIGINTTDITTRHNRMSIDNDIKSLKSPRLRRPVEIIGHPMVLEETACII